MVMFVVSPCSYKALTNCGGRDTGSTWAAIAAVAKRPPRKRLMAQAALEFDIFFPGEPSEEAEAAPGWG
jgi:hypothetical protein